MMHSQTRLTHSDNTADETEWPLVKVAWGTAAGWRLEVGKSAVNSGQEKV